MKPAVCHSTRAAEKLLVSNCTQYSVPGVSLRTVQDWEQGRRTPSGPAKALLRIAEQQPKAFLEIG